MLKATIEVEVDPIPEDGPAFDEWFERNKAPLALYWMKDGKRAWSGELSSYIRGNDCVIYYQGAPMDFGVLGEMGITY